MKVNWGFVLLRGAVVGLIVAALLSLLAGCGDSSEPCPEITEENISRAIAAPVGSRCTQILLPPGLTREQVTFCALPLDQAGPPAPCEWSPS